MKTLILLLFPALLFAQVNSEAVLDADMAGTKTLTVSTVLATGVACADSTNAVSILTPLQVRGNNVLDVVLFGLKITDSVKFMQYSWTTDTWIPLRTYVQNVHIVAPGGVSLPNVIPNGGDTALTWISRVITPPLGATIKARVELVTDGAVKAYRGVNDTTAYLRWRKLYSGNRK